MATSYDNIYSRFLSKITDYTIAQMTDGEIESQLDKYLLASIVKFRYCNKLSIRDDNFRQFEEDLTDEEIEILSSLMCVEHLTPKILADDLLRQNLNSTDYKTYSPANHIKELRELRDQFKKEADSLMVLYTFTKNKLDGFI